jgi:4-amino-4-deoxy-L-arabinose transferase-like glycosyltransferase
MHSWLGVSQFLWWMRLPSLLAGAATVAALVLLARRWLPLGWSVLAGFLLALNPLFAAWTIQARPYTAATLFAVLSMAALVSERH